MQCKQVLEKLCKIGGRAIVIYLLVCVGLVGTSNGANASDALYVESAGHESARGMIKHATIRWYQRSGRAGAAQMGRQKWQFGAKVAREAKMWFVCIVCKDGMIEKCLFARRIRSPVHSCFVSSC